MCKIVEFPRKKELSNEMKEAINKLAEDYVNVLYEALTYFEVDEFDYSEIDKVGMEIAAFFAEQLEQIVEEKEEGF